MGGFKTQIRLMESAEALLNSVPYDKLTIARITGPCGVSRQVFYKYFSDKEDLIAQMIVRFIYTGLATESSFTWSSLIAHFLTELRKHRRFFLSTTHTADPQVLYRSLLKFTLLLYRDMLAYVERGPIDRTLDVLLQIYCRGGIDYLTQWAQSGMKESVEQLLDYFERGMPPEIHSRLLSGVFPAETVTVHQPRL